MIRIPIALILLFLGLDLVAGNDTERAEQKAFKGFELYSWRENDGPWLFALLEGTNRAKSTSMIKKDQIIGVEQLALRLQTLAIGENVSWWNHDLEGFAYPDEAIQRKVLDEAKRAQVKVDLAPSTTK